MPKVADKERILCLFPHEYYKLNLKNEKVTMLHFFYCNNFDELQLIFKNFNHENFPKFNEVVVDINEKNFMGLKKLHDEIDRQFIKKRNVLFRLRWVGNWSQFYTNLGTRTEFN